LKDDNAITGSADYPKKGRVGQHPIENLLTILGDDAIIQVGLYRKPVCMKGNPMRDRIDQVMRRTRQYWNIDGLPELGFGLICLLLAAYFYIQSTLAADTLLSQVLNLSFILLIIGGGLASNRLISYLKRRITYPRTGYVAYRRSPRSRRLVLGLAAGLISASLVGLLSFTESNSFWMPTATALLIAAVFAYIAYRGSSNRYYLLALASLVIGAITALAGLTDLLGLAVYYGGMGLVQVVSGGLVFRRFLAENKLADEDER